MADPGIEDPLRERDAGIGEMEKSESESCSVVSDSLWPHGLDRPWNSPGQNAGVGSLSLLQGIFPTQGWTQVSHIAGGFFTRWATRVRRREAVNEDPGIVALDDMRDTCEI